MMNSLVIGICIYIYIYIYIFTYLCIYIHENSYYVFMILFILLSTSHSLWIPYWWLMDSLLTIYRSPTNSICSSQYIAHTIAYVHIYVYHIIYIIIYIYIYVFNIIYIYIYIYNIPRIFPNECQWFPYSFLMNTVQKNPWSSNFILPVNTLWMHAYRACLFRQHLAYV